MKKVTSIILVCLLLALGTASVFAQSTYSGLSYINITVNDTPVAFAGDSYKLENGDEVPFSVLYEGTTYVPMRKLAELLGKEVAWDENSYTATITSSDKKYEITAVETQKKTGEMSTVDAEWNIINIVVDGNKAAKEGESYKLDNGKTVPFSILYKGTTYLPLRKIAEILYKDVSYDAETMTAMIKEAEIIPVIGYDKMTDVQDYGKLYDLTAIDQSVYENLMSYSYEYNDKTDANIKAYKALLEKSGFKLIDTQTPEDTAFSQEYTVYHNEKNGEAVGIIVTTVKDTEEKIVSILLGRENPDYVQENE